MNPEKRKVSTDALETLGTIITDGGRDAIHLAVEPVEAGESLNKGEDLVLIEGKAFAAIHHPDQKPLGIADPFLKERIQKGQKFWLVVYPRQITSLRHVWSHPDFPEDGIDKVGKAFSENWVRGWIQRTDDAPTYEDLIALVTGGEISQDEYYGNRWELDGQYLLSHGRDASGEIDPALWSHLEVITGVRIIDRPTYFACSC